MLFLPQVTYSRVFRRDKYKCQLCGGLNCLSIHHITPRREGGSNHPRNLLTLCVPCHDYVELNELNYGDIMKKKKELEEKPRKKKKSEKVPSLWFRCSDTGCLCEIVEPTEKHYRLLSRGKLTAHDLLR